MDKFANQFKDINKMECKILNDFDVLHQNILNVEEIKAKLLTLQYIKDELAARENEKCKY